MEALRPVILKKIMTQYFDNLVDLVAMAQKAKAFLDDKLTLKEQSRSKGNNRKANKKNHGQSQSQNSQSSGFSRRGRFGLYISFHYGLQGTRRNLVHSISKSQLYPKMGHMEAIVHLYHSR
ncbi:hypothetical protein PanWU01x14_095420, partial [Parasponia andersonii]